MQVREAYRPYVWRVCKAHYDSTKPLPPWAPPLGPVEDSRDRGCEYCEHDAHEPGPAVMTASYWDGLPAAAVLERLCPRGEPCEGVTVTQDWEHESTLIQFSDGTRLRVDGPSAKAAADTSRPVTSHKIRLARRRAISRAARAAEEAFCAIADGLVLCRSVDGWSLHAPGSTDEAIASGAARAILSGPRQCLAAHRAFAAALWEGGASGWVLGDSGTLTDATGRPPTVTDCDGHGEGRVTWVEGTWAEVVWSNGETTEIRLAMLCPAAQRGRESGPQ